MNSSVHSVPADREEVVENVHAGTSTLVVEPRPRRSVPHGIPEREDAAGRNLLAFRPVKTLLKSRWYPGILQWPVTLEGAEDIAPAQLNCRVKRGKRCHTTTRQACNVFLARLEQAAQSATISEQTTRQRHRINTRHPGAHQHRQ